MAGVFAPSASSTTTSSGAGVFATSAPQIPAAPEPPVSATPEQDATAKSGVLSDIFNAPDNSLLGVIKNTITGIPKAAEDIVSGLASANVGQAFGNENLNETPAGVTANTILGTPGAALNTVGNISRQINRDTAGATAAFVHPINTTPVQPEQISPSQPISTRIGEAFHNNPISDAIFGSAPVPDMWKNGTQQMMQMGVGPKTAKLLGLPFGLMTAITDVYMPEEEGTLQAIARSEDPAFIEKTISNNYPALKENAPTLAQTLTGVKDPRQVGQMLRDALTKKTADALAAHPANPDLTYEPTAPKEKETEPVVQTEVPKEQPVTPTKVPASIPTEFKALAEEATKHPDAHSFLSAATKSPELMDELHNLRTNPIEGTIKDPAAFYKAATEEHVPDEMAESQRLSDEANTRSLKSLENWGKEDIPEKYDVQPGTWQSMLKDFSRNLPGDSKVDILDYLRTPEHVLERVGLQPAAELLQNAKDSYRTTLATELDKIQGWKNEVEKNGNPDSSRRIFKYLDGDFKGTKPEMTETEYATAQKIKNYFKQWADRLGLPEENRVSNYVTHLFADTDEHGATVFDDPEMKNLMADQPAKSVYDPFLQKRINKPGYKQDVWAALDAYAKRGTRKEAFDPALSKLESMARPMDDSVYEYVTHLTHQINMRPARLDTLVDNLLKKTPGIGDKIGDRPVNRFTSKVRAIFNRASVGLNVRSAVRILSQGANTYAKLGEKYTVLGYYDFIKNAAGRNLGDLHDAGVLKDSFVQDRKAGVYKSLLQKIEPALYTMFDAADKINRGSAFYGARREALSKGLPMDQATLYAKRIVRDTHFDFSPVNSSVGTLVGLKGDITKSAMQFLDYTQRQGEFLTDMLSHGIQKGMNKDLQGAAHELLGLVRWSAATYLFAATIGKAIGYTASDILPALTADTNPLMRVGGDVATAVGDVMSGNVQGALDEGTDIAGSFVPGYSQGKNTVSGISDVAKGKVINSSGQTVATVPQTPENYVKGALFGPSSLSLDQANKLNDIYAILDKQSKGSGAIKSANTEYQKLKQIQQTQGNDAANAAYEQLKQTNPDQAKLVLQQINDEKNGITADEIAMKKLSVANRAQYLAQEFNEMNDSSQKRTLWEKYVTDKVITPEVSKALLPLLKT